MLPFRKWVIVIQQLQYKKSSDKLHHYSGIDRRILSPPTTEKQDKMPINTIEAAEREQRITALSPSGSGVPYSGWIVFAPAGMKRVSLQNPAKRDRRVRCSCGRGSARSPRRLRHRCHCIRKLSLSSPAINHQGPYAGTEPERT